jgi:hypothetical protein
MEDAKPAAELDQEPRHPVQRAHVRAQNHSVRRFFQRAQVGRDPALSIVQAELEQDLDGPAPGHGRQVAQDLLDAVEIQRSSKERLSPFER